MTGMSPTLAWAFPRASRRYDRYLTFREAKADERKRWQRALYAFVQKLTYKHGKPLVLKSPAHMGRLPLLLELFPEARFVHIHRHPFAVFKSTVHTARAVTKMWSLQRYVPPDVEAKALRQYREICEAFLEDRGLIEPGRLCEIGYDELVGDPVTTLRSVYERLGLPDFADAEPRIQEYAASLAGYRRNSFATLAAEKREEIYRECRGCFEAWGYAADEERIVSAAAKPM
jgi:hypothetical protein